MAYIDMQSSLPSKPMIDHLLYQSGIDVLVVAETWLNSEIDRLVLMIEIYSCDIRVDRADKRGGGGYYLL